MKLFTSLLGIILSLHGSTVSPKAVDAPTPKLIAITVSNLDNSIEWYKTHLQFETDTIMEFPDYDLRIGLLKLGDFFLELIDFENSVSKCELSLPDGKTEINGFFKMGFQTNDIEELYSELKDNKAKVVAPIDFLPPIKGKNWPEKYFLIEDPDGNYIQFFSKEKNPSGYDISLTPFLVAVSSPDIDSTIEWYKTHFGATLFSPKVGNKGNERVLIKIGDFIMEIGEFKGYTNFEDIKRPEGVSDFHVHGIHKLAFATTGLPEMYNQMKSANVTVSFDLAETDGSLVGNQYFIIKDKFGNSIQFFDNLNK